MEIISVTRKIVITINGVEHVICESDWTNSIKQAPHPFQNEEDIIDWIEND